MARIEAMDARVLDVPLAEVLTDAKHGDHTHFEIVTATVHLGDGTHGTGCTYTGGRGGRAIAAMIERDLAPFPAGRDASGVEALHDAMQWHVHYVGRGGVASFAIAAVDIALWDIRGKAAGQPLWKIAGGGGDRCRAYRSGIDLNFPLEKLVRRTEGHLGDGHDAVKIEVGQAGPGDGHGAPARGPSDAGIRLRLDGRCQPCDVRSPGHRGRPRLLGIRHPPVRGTGDPGRLP